MKLNHLETHDRLNYFTKQEFSIGECCQDLINKRPFGEYAFYIFAHTRTEEDGVTKRIIWQPRLTRPKMQPNSMLFKAKPGTDEIKVIWILPQEELWDQYECGLMLENKTVVESIYNYRYNREKMESKDLDDLEDWKIDDIYREISQNAKKFKESL